MIPDWLRWIIEWEGLLLPNYPKLQLLSAAMSIIPFGIFLNKYVLHKELSLRKSIIMAFVMGSVMWYVSFRYTVVETLLVNFGYVAILTDILMRRPIPQE